MTKRTDYKAPWVKEFSPHHRGGEAWQGGASKDLHPNFI